MYSAIPDVILVLEGDFFGLRQPPKPGPFGVLEVKLVEVVIGVRFTVSSTADLKPVEVLVLPAHHLLENKVEPVEGDIGRRQEPSPDGRLNVLQGRPEFIHGAAVYLALAIVFALLLVLTYASMLDDHSLPSILSRWRPPMSVRTPSLSPRGVAPRGRRRTATPW